MQTKKGCTNNLMQPFDFQRGSYWIRTSDPLLVRHEISASQVDD
jgi:hypothetical protein